MSERSTVHLEPWGQGDLALLQKMLGDPEMTKHIGGPEAPESIRQRQTGYEQEDSRQFKIVEDATGAATGWVGYWELNWRDEQIFEIGWSVLPGFQGRGIGSMATAGHRVGEERADAPIPARLPLRGQRAFERDLPKARLHAPGGL